MVNENPVGYKGSSFHRVMQGTYCMNIRPNVCVCPLTSVRRILLCTTLLHINNTSPHRTTATTTIIRFHDPGRRLDHHNPIRLAPPHTPGRKLSPHPRYSRHAQRLFRQSTIFDHDGSHRRVFEWTTLCVWESNGRGESVDGAEIGEYARVRYVAPDRVTDCGVWGIVI